MASTASQPGPVASSSKSDSTSSAVRDKRTDLRIPGLPSVNFSASAALIGTPYATSHAPPFEYPFPTPGTATPTSHHPPSYPPISPGGHNPFTFAPSLISSGKASSMGFTLPTFKRSSLPPASKPARPPIPPGLKEKAKEKKAQRSSEAK